MSPPQPGDTDPSRNVFLDGSFMFNGSFFPGELLSRSSISILEERDDMEALFSRWDLSSIRFLIDGHDDSHIVK